MSQPLADDAVIAAARSGDRGALDRLDQAVRPLLEDLAARCTCDPAGAGALVRDISVRVRLYLAQWHPDERFEAFVARLAVPQLRYHDPVDLRAAADRTELSVLPRTVGTPEQLGDVPHDAWLAFRAVREHYVALHLLHRSGLTADEVGAAVSPSPAAWAAELAALQAVRGDIDARFGPIGPAELHATDLFERFTTISAPQPAAVVATTGGRRIPTRVAVGLAGAGAILIGTISGIAAFTGRDAPATTVLGTSVTNTSAATSSTVASLTRPTLPPVSGSAPSPSPLAAAVGVEGTAGATTAGTTATITTSPRRTDPAPTGDTPATAPAGPDDDGGPPTGGSTSPTPQVTTSRPGTSTSQPGTSTSSTSTTSPGATTTTVAGTTTSSTSTTTSTTSTTSTTAPSSTTTSTTSPPTTTTTTPSPTTTSPPTTTEPPTTTAAPTTTAGPTTTTTPGGPGGGDGPPPG